MHCPPQVAAGCLVHRTADLSQVGSDMVLKSLLADVAQQLLQSRDLDDAGAAEGIKRVIGELAFSHVAADFALPIVSREARETHGRGLDTADASAVGVFLANGA